MFKTHGGGKISFTQVKAYDTFIGICQDDRVILLRHVISEYKCI